MGELSEALAVPVNAGAVLGSLQREGSCAPPCLGRWILQLVANRSRSGVRVTEPVLVLGGGRDNPSPCGFINLRAAIFKGLKDALSLRTPALHNGGLFP